MATRTTLEVEQVSNSGNGYVWIAYIGDDAYAIPGTWSAHPKETTPADAAFASIKAGWLAEGGTVKVIGRVDHEDYMW